MADGGAVSDGTLRLIGLLWAAMERGKGPLLLEEPELSQHTDIVRMLPQMPARARRRTGRQMFLATHSPELLRDEGIGLDETLLLIPGAEGTDVTPAGMHREIRSPDAESLESPKTTLVNLARLSRRKRIREDMAPRQDSGRQVGPAYVSRIIEYVDTTWRPQIAAQRADSLQRTIVCLRRLVGGRDGGQSS